MKTVKVVILAATIICGCSAEEESCYDAMDTQIAELSEDFASTLEGEEIDKYLHDDTYCVALDDTAKTETIASDAYIEYAKNYWQFKEGGNKAALRSIHEGTFTSVGVVPVNSPGSADGRICGGYTLVEVIYDTEDNNNCSKHIEGDQIYWKAESSNNVTMRFCEVPSVLFHRYYDDYAVLAMDENIQLDYNTPEKIEGYMLLHQLKFMDIEMDAEDKNPCTSVVGYDKRKIPFNIVINNKGNLRLSFLVFMAESGKYARPMPDLGFEYAVFGKLRDMQYEGIVVDDEDRNNANNQHIYNPKLLDRTPKVLITKNQSVDFKYIEDYKTMVEQDKNTLFHFSIIKRW